MHEMMSFEQGFILIDPKAMERANSHYDIYAQTSITCYLLALHYPLMSCSTIEEANDIQTTINENIKNITD
jgi:hypothetical protein